MSHEHAAVHEHEHEHEEEKLDFFSTPLKHDPAKQATHYASSDEEAGKQNLQGVPWRRDGALLEMPEFHRHEAAQSVELFYDLFFVANLTTFTGNLAIDTKKSLASYVGFFCILWFTWYNTTQYDVRFSVDSVIDRIFKVCNFGTMLALAAVGSKFNPEDQDIEAFQQLTLILMASRLTLATQYVYTLFWTRKYKQVVMPLIMVILMTLVAAIAYFALFFKFRAVLNAAAQTNDPNYVPFTNTYIWRAISFKSTHLQERLSLLTLIIIGEGIILLCKSVAYIVKSNWAFGAQTIGSIICALLIIIFYYMIYFDRVVEHHFGTIRQQIWAFGHFPFHIATVLVLEGTRQLVAWRQAFIAIEYVPSRVFEAGFWFVEPVSPEFVQQVYENLTIFSQETLAQQKGLDISAVNSTITSAISQIVDLATNESLGCELFPDGTVDTCTNSTESIYGLLSDISAELVGTEMSLIGIKVPKAVSKKSPKLSTKDRFAAYTQVLNFVYTYFFITAGLTLILIGVLHWISTPPKKFGDYFRGGSNFVIGIILCCLAAYSTNVSTEDSLESTPFENYLTSPWILPTLTILLFINLVLNHVRVGGC